MYRRALGSLPSAPAWDAVKAYTFAQLMALGFSQATSLLQAAAREAAIQEQAAERAGDNASALVLAKRETTILAWQDQANGGASSAGFQTLGDEAGSGFVPDLLGSLKTVGIVVGAVLAGAVVLPQLGKAIANARGPRVWE